MKKSLQSILETKSQYDFITSTMDNQQEDIASKTTYKTSFKFMKSKYNFSTTPKHYSIKPKKKKPIFLASNNNSADLAEHRTFIFLKTLFKDIQQPEMAKTNYSQSWQTSHKQTIQSNYVPPIKKNYLLIKTPDNSQPPVGYYNPKLMNKVRGSVRMHQSSHLNQSQSLNSMLNLPDKPETAQLKDEFDKVPEEKLQRFYDIEHKKLKFRQSFQLPLQDLNNNPFKKQWQTFLTYKNKLKLLRDHKYEETVK